MSNYNWTKLFSIRGGHKYFRDEISKRIALADNSGSTPDRTEDGVLWLDFSRCATIATDTHHNTYITIPLLRENGDKSATGASTKEVIEVCAKLGMKLALQGERYVMIQAESEVRANDHSDQPHRDHSDGHQSQC
jgi:hypothetical protein